MTPLGASWCSQPASTLPPKKCSPSPSRVARSKMTSMSGAGLADRRDQRRSAAGPATAPPGRSRSRPSGPRPRRPRSPAARCRPVRRSGLMNMSRWTWKSSVCSASRPRALSPWAMSRFDPKLTRPRGRYGRPSSAGGVQVLAGDEPEAGRAERPLADADRLRRLGRVEQLGAGDRVGRHGREQHVAAGGVEAAGQRVQDVDRPG